LSRRTHRSQNAHRQQEKAILHLLISNLGSECLIPA
jgi:hypothetical protein